MTSAQRANLIAFAARQMSASTGISEDHKGMRRVLGVLILATEIEVLCVQLGSDAAEQRAIADRFREGLAAGARIATKAACEAIGKAPVPEAAYPPHSVHPATLPQNLAPALLAAMGGANA